MEERRHEPVDVLEWRLANGVRVLLKATDFRDDEVVLNAFAPGGLSLAPDADVTSASFAADLVRVSGVGAFNLVELQRALAGKAASVAPSTFSLTGVRRTSSDFPDRKSLLPTVSIDICAHQPFPSESVATP